eukprot:446432_1
MARTIIESIKKLTNNLKKNQRICILVDRRWRINCKTFDAFNKLIQYRDNNNGNDIDDEVGRVPKESSWITKGWFDNKNDNNKHKELKANFYNNEHDTIYVYQPNLTRAKKKSYHEFKDNFCEQTLLYPTKQCI